MKKQWLSARNGKVRPSHVSLDSQIAELHENFKLSAGFGGHVAQSPGEFGIAKEDINCHCTMIPLVIDNTE